LEASECLLSLQKDARLILQKGAIFYAQNSHFTTQFKGSGALEYNTGICTKYFKGKA
jgi:hypothetical protein